MPFRIRPRVTETQIIEGHLVDPGCPVCGRSDVQHGQYSCAVLDGIAERVAYGKLPRWRRALAFVTRTRPAGW